MACDNKTSENTLREFPLVIATIARVSRKRGLWLVVRVNKRHNKELWKNSSLLCIIGDSRVSGKLRWSFPAAGYVMA